eukprot:2100779-Rhodomonas_salina.2
MSEFGAGLSCDRVEPAVWWSLLCAGRPKGRETGGEGEKMREKKSGATSVCLLTLGCHHPGSLCQFRVFPKRYCDMMEAMTVGLGMCQEQCEVQVGHRKMQGFGQGLTMGFAL